MVYLEQTGLINRLLYDNKGMCSLGKVQKLYLNNTNMVKAIGAQNATVGYLCETIFFESNQKNPDVIATSISELQIDEFTFEIGGKNKKQTQIKKTTIGFVVKDAIEYGMANIIPLWLLVLCIIAKSKSINFPLSSTITKH